VADVHFDPSLAVEAARLGASKLRINPGNIGDLAGVDMVVDAAGEAGIPIRIGVNAGSLAEEVVDRDWPLEEKLAASAVAFVEHFEQRGFVDIVVSAKASSVVPTIEAYRRLACEIPYPLHLGITEAGPGTPGVVRSAVGIGALLLEGIGDTIRASLTGDPTLEVEAAWEILASLDIRRRGPELIACPTCGRCQVDLAAIALEISARLRDLDAPLKVAVMGCVVNGPGEAREADVGLAAGRGSATLFVHGEPVRTVSEADMVDELMAEVARLASRA
jgi:(E)-4-hydroxy-3-methylbut-2-enyl-diphosphate synthase